MKKRILIVALTFVLGCSLLACGNKGGDSDGNVEKTQEQTENVNSHAEPSVYDLAISKDLEIDESINNYFDGDAVKAIKKMEPMLMSAARSARKDMGTVILSGNDNVESQWYIVQGLIAAYGGDATNTTENYVIMNLDMVAKYFNSCFADFKLPVPDLPQGFSTTFDSETSDYKVPCLDVPETYFTVKGITLSKANSSTDPTMSATIAVELSDPATEGNPVYGTAEVEVVKNPDSIYGYSIQSLTYTEK
ncbi:hypothetical protein [Aminipila sp.]|uniref:hypothetical protein n=1 Tax=Aminipila sp. TaxID=2060095 RepID=UPI00289A4F21|nr:hypothetical protein [Aminipila sp.]